MRHLQRVDNISTRNGDREQQFPSQPPLQPNLTTTARAPARSNAVLIGLRVTYKPFLMEFPFSALTSHIMMTSVSGSSLRKSTSSMRKENM